MSWYSQMMKSQELARERNRRDARRLESERYGPQFIAKYRLAALDKEKRIIEKELERIRKGVHRPPRMADVSNAKGNHVLTIPSPRVSEHKPHIHSINPEYSKDENKLYDAILFLQNNPSALVPILTAHAQSDAYFETLERVTPRVSNEIRESKPIQPKYLQESVSKTEKDELISKYTVLLHRHSPELRKSSPLLNRKRNSPIQRKDSPLIQRKDSPLIHDITNISSDPTELKNKGPLVGSSGHESTDDESDNRKSAFMTNFEEENGSSKISSSSITPRKSRQPLPISQLVDSGMSTARENVSQRLTGSNEDNQSAQRYEPDTEHLDKQQETSASSEQQHLEERKPKPKAQVMFPSCDPEIYNADGSLRTCLTLPSFDESIKEAGKARYLRRSKRDTRESDRELSVQEIFEK